MVDSVLEVQNIKLPDSGGTTGADVFTSTSNVPTIASGVTFPAGHVLQVVHTETTETNSLTTSFANYYEVPLTLKSSSSDVIVSFTFNYYLDTASSGFGVRIYRGDSSSVTTSDTSVWTKNASNTTSEFTFWTGGSSIYSVSTITGKDTITGKSAGDTIYYGLFAKIYVGSSAVEFPANGNVQEGFFSSLIMEVQK